VRQTQQLGLQDNNVIIIDLLGLALRGPWLHRTTARSAGSRVTACLKPSPLPVPLNQLNCQCLQDHRVVADSADPRKSSGIWRGVVRIQSGPFTRAVPWSVQNRSPAQGQRVRVRQVVALPTPETLFPPRRFMGSDSVWFGDGHQGSHDITRVGCKGIAGLPPEVLGPSRGAI
jgi:hypothetical protein